MARWLSTPAEVTVNYLAWLKKLKEGRGLTFGCILDKHIIPLRPGDLMAVVARTGHGKSAMMAYMAKRVAQGIIANGILDEVVIYATWEQSQEEIESLFEVGTGYSSTQLAWGDFELGVAERALVHRPGLPIWLMGNSLASKDPKREPMTVDAVYSEIRGLWDEFGKRPALICLDYLQIIPTDNMKERNHQVHEATIQAKQLALAVGCPIIAGVQAGRSVDSTKSHIPRLSDCQWSSGIEQTADKVMALYMPIKEYEKELGGKEPDRIEYEEITYYDPACLLVVRLLKQRFDVGYGTWAVHFKPQTLEMNDYDLTGRESNNDKYWEK